MYLVLTTGEQIRFHIGKESSKITLLIRNFLVHLQIRTIDTLPHNTKLKLNYDTWILKEKIFAKHSIYVLSYVLIFS